MNRIISYCISVILIIGGASCDFQAVQSDNYPPPLYKPPPAYLFNPEGGYDFNPLLNKPITPVINPSNNDTIETGTPFLLRAERYSLDSIKIDTLPALPIKDWEVISARTNKYPAKWIKSGKSIVFDSLKSFDITETHSDFTIRKYQSQDIVPSGKAIPISPEKVSLPLSEPVINPITNSISNGSQNFKSTGTPTEYESSSNRSITLDKYSNIWVTKNGYTYHCISQNHIISYKNRGGFWGWQNVLNDSKGNIWSTKTKELLCYNGETFTSYPFPGIRVIINIIIEDKHGNLWIGMNGLGLGKFDGQSLTYYTTKEGLSGNYVYSISEDNKGRLWIGTNNGISIFDHQKFYHINEENGLIAKHILSVFADNDSSIWFASYEKGIHQLKGNNLYTIKLNKLEHKSVWVNTFESYLSTQSSPHIVKDKKNNIWVASKYGLCKISENRENIEVFSTKDGLNSNFIQDIAQDSHGNFITAQQYGGLSIRPVNSIVHYSNNIDIENTWIDGLFEDHQGRIWQAADEQQSIIVMENDTLYRNANLAKQFGILTMAFEEDKNGDIWMGGEGGIMRYDGKYAYSYNLGFTSGRYVWNIRCLDSGNILITGLMGGYLLYDGSGFKHYFADSNPRLLITSSSAEDPEGKIWLDSRPNNLLLDGDSVTFYSEKEGFFWGGSRENLIDQSGNRWFAGRYGVQVLSGDSIYFIGQEQGLYQNEYDMHYEIVEDRNGNIWLISGSVITCFITQKESSSFEIENIITLTRWNGMKGNWATTSSFMIDRENKLWVGTEKGSSYLDLNEVNLTPAEVKPQLISLDINSKFLDYRNMYDSLKKDIQFSEMIPFANVPKDLELNYRQNHLTFFYD
ncbi:MAG: two-component regulator propeller domain-containing protein, partial [Bacteroidota bacterium]